MKHYGVRSFGEFVQNLLEVVTGEISNVKKSEAA
jgi:hypothetical protein